MSFSSVSVDPLEVEQGISGSCGREVEVFVVSVMALGFVPLVVDRESLGRCSEETDVSAVVSQCTTAIDQVTSNEQLMKHA